ncbi:hypothetical protein Y88_1277 [Novosphingobium nitrogenifigens DSM 19370]|uniref:Gamma-glutamylcyclotransferase AIG2-like domain-containing protein n=1 Tax=Novosphingobium nitrogenifigens DSM 19370 TaxID=983920 RepID=F1Z810_9SPHN|nr:gamma-glutamylcyclotransferase [Novosphingobium nitrogenifigens]EGD59215.1 hypothetical protein Y88_1277 [Novosphingobium nitrogenifigens DSM 19370]
MTELNDADLRLATYGTLAPGRPNAHQLADLGGTWATGVVRGRLIAQGWGADLGFPGMVPDEDGEEIAVHLFYSSELPAHWPRLDAFEGEGYRRVPVQVLTEQGLVWASIYALAAGQLPQAE